METPSKKDSAIQWAKRILLLVWYVVAAAFFAAVLAVLASGYIEQELGLLALDGIEYTIAEIEKGTLDFFEGSLDFLSRLFG